MPPRVFVARREPVHHHYPEVNTMKLLKLDTDRRADAAPLRKSRLFASGVLRPKSDPRPSVRFAALVDGAGLRVTHTPADDPTWRPAA
jgi:hypothetical protein